MFAQNESFLSAADRLGRRMELFNRVIGTLAERLLPQATAEAACSTGWTYCYSECDYGDAYCQAHGPGPGRRYDWYAPNRAGCAEPTRACNAGCLCG